MTNSHAKSLEQEMLWLKECIQLRINTIKGEARADSTALSSPPQLSFEGSAYGDFVSKHTLSLQERVVLALALANPLNINFLNCLAADPEVFRTFKACGSENKNAVIPTAETALFIIAGDNTEERLKYRSLFSTSHVFYKLSVISLGEIGAGDSPHNTILSLTASYIDLFLNNEYSRPRFSSDFPAHLLTTKLGWDDMLLMPTTKERLEETKAYLQYQNKLVNDWEMGMHARPGCRILFYGDSGTGKTLAATLLGKHLEKDVYRVDLSAVSSKYIGETSKRLDSLFNTAESKGWIIFFDEGDALLGQRQSTNTESSNSHYANQDTAFLLQRIESYDGIIIVATNFKNNIDQAFTRRFQSMVRFQLPDQEIQYQLWINNLPKKCPLAPGIDLMCLIQRHSLSPASIMNVIFRVCVLALQKGASSISSEDLIMCIKDEELKYMGRKPMGL